MSVLSVGQRIRFHTSHVVVSLFPASYVRAITGTSSTKKVFPMHAREKMLRRWCEIRGMLGVRRQGAYQPGLHSVVGKQVVVHTLTELGTGPGPLSCHGKIPMP